MFSIIVSIYKVEKYLKQCIDSILAQTYTDFELILVDDGSPDDCAKICDFYSANDKRVKVIHKQNGGLMTTRKVGLKMAEGKYICFIDGDDFVSPDMLETYAKILEKNDVDIICSEATVYSDKDTRALEQKIPCGVYNKDNMERNVYPYMLSTQPFYSFYVIPSVCSKCFKKNIVEIIYDNIPDDISLGEDVAATYPALLKANSIYVTDYKGYMYRQNLSSMTHTYDKNLYFKIRKLVLYLKKVAETERVDFEKQINEYAMCLLIFAVNNEFVFNKNDKYFLKKKNMLLYLNDNVFALSIKDLKLKRLKNKFILYCFKNRILWPLYLISKKNA